MADYIEIFINKSNGKIKKIEDPDNPNKPKKDFPDDFTGSIQCPNVEFDAIYVSRHNPHTCIWHNGHVY